MTSPASVQQWKEINAHRLVECRWGCSMTVESCRTYQTRAKRYIIHFGGHGEQHERANAEYLSCLNPVPCPHLLSDEELMSSAASLREEMSSTRKHLVNRARVADRLVNPSCMLQEADWRRSLVNV